MASTLRLARTNAEAHIYMDLHPCACGEGSFARTSSVIEVDGELASRYTGTCAGCGKPRQFTFAIPEEVRRAPSGSVVFGYDGQSELLDAGEWLFVADRYARAGPASYEAGTDAAKQARRQVATAAAAMGEALAFVPDGGRGVPYESLRSVRGRAAFEAEPGRFDKGRLEVVRDTYRQILAELDDQTA